MRRLGLVAALLLCIPAPALSANLITHPDWVKTPSADDLERVAPVEALRRGINGSVVMQCQVTSEGRLALCEVRNETPKGAGFGAATLSVAPLFRMKPPMINGAPVADARVEVRLSFVSPPADRSAPGDPIRLINAPVWSQTPTLAQIKAAFPFAAGKVDAGRVDLVCQVRPDGSLWKCDPHSEWPQNNGFGRAAVALANDFKIAIDPTDPPLPKNAAVELLVAFHNPNKPAPQPVITAPVWTHGVDPASLPAIYPAKAAEAGVKSGRGVVDCVVDHWGRLGGCVAIRETPEGLGFGEAAVQVASAMAMSPWTTDGEPVDGAHLHLPVDLKLPDAAATPANP